MELIDSKHRMLVVDRIDSKDIVLEVKDSDVTYYNRIVDSIDEIFYIEEVEKFEIIGGMH